MKIFPIQLCFVWLTLSGVSAQPMAQNSTPAMPYPPLPPSPVAIFRMLLATNETGRTQWIAKWKPAQRDYLESKVAEFTKLSVSERELRLQTLELRWYLPQLMKMNSAERIARLAAMPERERTLLESKLQTWDSKPSQIKQDLLDYHEAISILMFPGGGATSENVLRGLPPERQAELQKQFEHLNQLPAERR